MVSFEHPWIENAQGLKPAIKTNKKRKPRRLIHCSFLFVDFLVRLRAFFFSPKKRRGRREGEDGAGSPTTEFIKICTLGE